MLLLLLEQPFSIIHHLKLQQINHPSEPEEVKEKFVREEDLVKVLIAVKAAAVEGIVVVVVVVAVVVAAAVMLEEVVAIQIER